MQTLLCHKTDVILATSSQALQYHITASLSFLEAEPSIWMSAGVLREHIQEFCAAPPYANSPNKGLIPCPPSVPRFNQTTSIVCNSSCN